MERTFRDYEALKDFLREWTTWSGDPAIYDAGGIFYLWQACLENICTHALDAELEDFASLLTDPQRRLVMRFYEVLSRTEPRPTDDTEDD